MSSWTGWRDAEGATTSEYAVIVGLIAIFIVGAVTALGISVDDLFRNAVLRDALTP